MAEEPVRPDKHWVVKAYEGGVNLAYAADRGLMKTMDTLDNVATALVPRDESGGLRAEVHDLLVPAGVDHLPNVPRSCKRHVPKPGRGCCDFLLDAEDEDYDVRPYKYLSVPMSEEELRRAQAVYQARQGRSMWEDHDQIEKPSIFPVPPSYAAPPPPMYGRRAEWEFWEPPPEIEDDYEYQKQAAVYQGIVKEEYEERDNYRADGTIYGEVAYALS